jgi:hypothetical protein
MSSASLALYMNKRPVTGWLTSLHFQQTRDTYYRQCDLTFASWHEIEDGARWDLFGSYDPDDPRSEILIRNGVIPDDQRLQFRLARGQDVPITLTIYDWAWRAQRISHPTTLVVAKSLTDGRRAVAEYGQPVGRYTTLVTSTLSGAVRALATLGGVWLDWRLPDYDLSAQVLAPVDDNGTSQAIFQSIRTLCDPYRPEYYFRRDTDCLVLSDRLATEFAVGTRMTFGERSIAAPLNVTARTLGRRVRRVIVELKPWH